MDHDTIHPLKDDAPMIDHLTRIHGDLGQIKAEVKSQGAQIVELRDKVDEIAVNTASDGRKELEDQLAIFKAAQAKRADFMRSVAEKVLLVIVGGIATQIISTAMAREPVGRGGIAPAVATAAPAAPRVP